MLPELSYEIYDSEGQFINIIVSDPLFIEEFTKRNGWTYILVNQNEESEEKEPSGIYSEQERIDFIEGQMSALGYVKEEDLNPEPVPTP